MRTQRKQTFIRTITVNGNPYVLFIEYDDTGNGLIISCINNKELPEFKMTHEDNKWRIIDNIFDKKQFEEKLTFLLNEQVASK